MAALPSELGKVNPADAWAPYRPGTDAPWDRKWVSHLYRRAAFGATPAEVEKALADGFEKTLAHLMTGDADSADKLELLRETGQYYTDPHPLRVWWLYSMLESGHPLREKLTLFWHNHFATSYAKVRSTKLMFQQNLTLRKHALGKFRPFLLDMSKDTAMLVWLDSNRNVKGAPNENYAREVMELFSLGVGNYTEKDIQEAARAFTGWHHDAEVTTFENVPALHDDGEKTVLGQSGKFTGSDIVRVCCEQKACAKFLVSKLYTFLVSETPPPKGLLTPLEDRFRGSDYDIADLVKAIIGSRLFFSEHAYRKRVKWPVEYALGLVRAVVPGRIPLADVIDPLAKMGQVLFAPPNVKGWRTGTDWLNSATLLARNNFAESVAVGNWARVSARAPSGQRFEAVTKAAPVEAVQQLVDYPIEGAAAVAGAAAAYGGIVTVDPGPGRPAGSPPLIAVMSDPAMPEALPPGAQPPGVIGNATNTAPPPPDSKLDVTTTVMATKPATATALATRLGELLYGQELTPAARKKIETFLLADKKAVGEKEMDDKDFRAKLREAVHALMCLPEYQLG
jgi:hypothetical protein